MAAIIETRHLTHIYNAGMPDATTALEDVSFAVEEGDFVGIIGSTGSGKSTLITHFNGILKPTSGQVLLDGKDIWAKGQDIRKVRFSVGLCSSTRSTSCLRRLFTKISPSAPKTWV